MPLGHRRRRQAVVAGGLVTAGVVLSGFPPGSAGGLSAFLAAAIAAPLTGLWLRHSPDRPPTPIAPSDGPRGRIRPRQKRRTGAPDVAGRPRGNEACATPNAEPRGKTPPCRAPAFPWVVLTAAVLAWEMLALVTPPRVLHLTLSSLVLHFRAVRAVAFVGWSAAGVGLAAADVDRDRARRVRRASERDPGPADHVALATLAVLVGTDPVVGIAFWSLVALGAGALELVARRRSLASPLTTLLTELLERRPGRVLLAAAWLVTGWHLFAHYPT